ncbi:MAG: hypothetical protein GWP05_08065 [Anaerolineaceae bacterium]|nr:hypothetical protein [Anaerolineaceae bacterium]
MNEQRPDFQRIDRALRLTERGRPMTAMELHVDDRIMTAIMGRPTSRRDLPVILHSCGQLQAILARGGEREVRAAVGRVRDEVHPGGGVILSSSNSITNYCKIENYLAMLGEARK